MRDDALSKARQIGCITLVTGARSNALNLIVHNLIAPHSYQLTASDSPETLIHLVASFWIGLTPKAVQSSSVAGQRAKPDFTGLLALSVTVCYTDVHLTMSITRRTRDG